MQTTTTGFFCSLGGMDEYSTNDTSLFDPAMSPYGTGEDDDIITDYNGDDSPTSVAPHGGQGTLPAATNQAFLDGGAAVDDDEEYPSSGMTTTRIAFKRSNKKLNEHSSGLSAFKKLVHSHVIPFAKFVAQDDDLKSSSNSDTFFLFCHGFAGNDVDKLREAKKRWDKHRNRVRTIVREKRGSMVDTMKNAFMGKKNRDEEGGAACELNVF